MFKILTATILLLSISAKAQLEPRAEVVAFKSQLEESIAKRYRERIATQVPLELFNVAVQVELLNPPEDKPKEAAIEGLSDITLGIIESVTSTGLPNEVRSGMNLKKIEVIVGLSPKLGDEYKAKFKPWLANSVKKEFGKYGIANFADIAPMPKEEIKELQPLPPRQLTFEEKFGHYQNVLGFALFSLFLLIGVLLMKFLPSRDAKEQFNVALRIQEMKNSQLQLNNPDLQKLGDQKSEPKELQLSANLLFDNLKEHQRKVAMIAFSNGELIGQVFERWFDEGDIGRKKVASLIDSLLIQVGPKNPDGVIPFGNLNWSLPERIKKDKELPETFRSFANMTLQEKTSLAEKTYWDILSMKTLGDQMSKNLFASVASLSSTQITKLLSTQDKKIQSIAVLHLPQEKMEQVVLEMTFDEKKNVIFQALDMPRILEKDLELADESLRFLVKQEEKLEDGLIEIQSLVPQMLMCLNTLEEIQMIQQIVPRLSDRGGYLKSNYPSLAFIAEWPEEKLRSLISSAQPQDLLCLLKVLPETTEQVFSTLPSRTQIILKDSMAKEVSKEEMIRGLETLKLRMYKMVNDGQLVLSQVFPQKMEPPARAA